MGGKQKICPYKPEQSICFLTLESESHPVEQNILWCLFRQLLTLRQPTELHRLLLPRSLQLSQPLLPRPTEESISSKSLIFTRRAAEKSLQYCTALYKECTPSIGKFVNLGSRFVWNSCCRTTKGWHMEHHQFIASQVQLYWLLAHGQTYFSVIYSYKIQEYAELHIYHRPLYKKIAT